MRRIQFLIFGLLALMLAAPGLAVSAPSPPVVLLKLDGDINPVAANYVARGLAAASAQDAQLVVLELDTPGGLDTAMRAIIKKILASPVPVAVYVYPSGGRAASAGMYITESAQIAAMAPGTAIGAAHPVGSQGQDIKGTLGRKIENDAAAYAKGLAKDHGRSAVWAEAAVRQSISATAEEATSRHVVDLEASSLPALLGDLDGRKVQVLGTPQVLHTRGAPVHTIPMDPFEGFLYAISNPTMAVILLNLGMLGLFFELSRPGAVLPGTVGVICLLLAFFSLGSLSVNFVGLGLMVFGFVLFASELFLPSHGALTLGGVVALALGGVMLINGNIPGISASRWVAVIAALVVGGLAFLAIAIALRARHRPVATGREALVGKEGEVRSPLAPEGLVFVDGALWKAVAPLGATIPQGAKVVIRQVQGLTLRVEEKEKVV